MSFNVNPSSGADTSTTNINSTTSATNIINLPASEPAALAAGSSTAPAEMSNPPRQFIDVNRFIQSNAFLRSDLGDLVNMPPQNLPAFSNPGLAPSQATTVVYPNSRSGATALQNRSHGNTTPDQEEQQAQQPFVLNFGNQQQQQQQPAEQAGDQAPPNLIADALGAMTSSLPFVLIFIAKIFHQHLLGFIIVLGFLVTLHWSNRFLVNQVDLKEKKKNHKLILLILFLVLNITVFFLIFSDYKLQNCLVFMSTNIHKMDTWNLIWIVVCSDTIIKFMVICIKAIITLVPLTAIPLRRRGSFYSAIEAFALFYRSLTPIHPWILYILYYETNIQISTLPIDNTKLDKQIFDESSSITSATHTWSGFSTLLCVMYIVFKLNQLYNRFVDLQVSFADMLNDTAFGVPVSPNDLQENVCPICQDNYKSPVALKCRHAFCQDCISIWLDKENNCPMCRTRVAVKKPKFRDGSTTIMIQLF